MVKIKFKKQVRKNIFQPNRVVTVSFRTPTMLGRRLVGTQKHGQRFVMSMKKANKPTSLWNPSMNRPGAAFWGDKDGDGVYNGLDCEPSNPKKQGAQHAKLFGQDGQYVGDEEQSFIDADEDREFQEDRQKIEDQKIHDFGVAFNASTRVKVKEKAKSTKLISDDAQSLIDLS